jgi:hypothetical protein
MHRGAGVDVEAEVEADALDDELVDGNIVSPPRRVSSSSAYHTAHAAEGVPPRRTPAHHPVVEVEYHSSSHSHGHMGSSEAGAGAGAGVGAQGGAFGALRLGSVVV